MLLAAATATGARGEVWNQWRGPTRDGKLEGASWPADLDGLESVWQVELGKGYSGPIVVVDRVYVAETVAGTEESVRALSRANGSEIWRVSWPAEGKVPFFAKSNGDWIRSTPAHDGSAIYVGGMEEVLVKLDADSGEELWRVDFPARFGTRVPDFGFSSSPLIDGEHLYVQAANSLVKLDKASGETVWRALENDGNIMRSGAFSSPIVAELAGRRQLVVQMRETLNGVDPETGAVLWSQPVPSFRGMNILTPTVHGDRILTSTYRNKTFFYDISAGADGFSSAELWTHKSQGYMSSPVIVDGHAYLHLGNGRLACIDLETGAERWISEPMGRYWSIVAQAGKLLALNDRGELYLIAASPERLEILGRRRVSERPTWAHLAVSGDELFVRDLEGVVAFRWNAAPAAGASIAP